MKIALAQINPIVGDIEGNTELILRELRKAKSLGAELIIFPEMCITGYPPKDILQKFSFVIKNKKAAERIAEETNGIYAVVGFVDYDPNKKGKDGKEAKYNAAALLGNGKIIGVQYKTLLPTYDVFDEHRYFIPAKEHDIFNITLADGKTKIKLGMEICEDLWDNNYETKVTSILADKGADMIINISASPFECCKRKVRENLLKEKAVRNNVPIIYANLVGGQDDLVFDGESLAVDRKGTLIAAGKKFQEDFVLIDLDMKTKEGISVAVQQYTEIQEIHDALVLALKDYFRKSGFKGAVIGLSGGIDSAVTAVIAAEALGKENVIGVSMPSQYSSGHSKDDAKELAKNLGIRYETVPIKDVFESFKNELNPVFSGCKEDITEENLQARIRGTLLMALANKFNHLLLATGNKSELAVGYCTLYGDMNGGYCVLSDVLKVKVYGLADYINRNGIIIPKSTIEKAPSAELRPGQKDQDTLPPYDILDGILKAYIEEGRGKQEIIDMGFEKETVEWVLNRVDNSEFKRRQAALGLKITGKAFGTGRLMPVVNRYRN